MGIKKSIHIKYLLIKIYANSLFRIDRYVLTGYSIQEIRFKLFLMLWRSSGAYIKFIYKSLLAALFYIQKTLSYMWRIYDFNDNKYGLSCRIN